MSTGAYFTSADDLASVSSDWVTGRRTQLDVVINALQNTAGDPSPTGRSEQALVNIRRETSFREQFLKVRELRIQLTLRPWPIAGPRR
jgi:hypothetical protein